MEISKVPYKNILFVCTHAREEEAACANPDRGADGGQHLVELLREELNRRGLKGKIRVAKSGCMDLCARGPNIMVFDAKGEYAWYKEVSAADIPAIVEKYFAPEEEKK